MHIRNSLALKITLSVGVIFAVLLLLVSVLYSLSTMSEFAQFIEVQNEVQLLQSDQGAAVQISRRIAETVDRHGRTDAAQSFDAALQGVSETGFAFLLLDEKNQVVVSSDDLFADAVIEELDDRLALTVSGEDDFELVYHGLIPDFGERWGFKVLAIPLPDDADMEVPDDPVDQFRVNLKRQVFWLFLVFLVLGLVAIWWMIKRQARPLSDLTQATLEIKKGTFPDPIPVKGKDEIAELTDHFNQALQQLHKQDRARKQMVSDIAHELRTPLTNVTAKLAAIRDGIIPVDPPTLRLISEEVGFLSQLVSDLQDLSLAESGDLKFFAEATSLHVVTQQVITGFQHNPKYSNFELSNATDPEIEVCTDPFRLKQILVNLVDNALKQADKEVTVTVSNVDSGERVGLTVTDNGPGIPADKLAHIFDRKFQIAQGNRDHNFGFGLGLSIVKQLIESQGNQIEVDSKPGKTCFTIWF